MIERKPESKSARSILFEEFNDIDIYVEDSAIGYKKIYKELLKKVFGDELKIEHILPIGNRGQVIKECKNSQDNQVRKQVYIIDGDLHLLTDQEKEIKKLKGLYILPRYCIENYLISKKALINILYEEDPELELHEIEQRFNYNKWLNENEKILVDLFSIYTLYKQYSPEVKTTAYRVSKLCSGPTGIVCPIKTNLRIKELRKDLIEKIGKEKFDRLNLEINKKRLTETNTFIRYVSAKDYIIPLLFARIKNTVKSTSDNLNLKIRLAINSDIEELVDLKKHVMN